MNRESIEKTAFCYMSAEDKCLVVESSKFPIIAGVGDTEQEAWDCFNLLLDEMMRDLDADKVAGFTKPGRPAKNGVQFHAQVQQSTKDLLENLSTAWGISQADVLDHLAFFYNRTKDMCTLNHLCEQIIEHDDRISNLEHQIATTIKIVAEITGSGQQSEQRLLRVA